MELGHESAFDFQSKLKNASVFYLLENGIADITDEDSHDDLVTMELLTRLGPRRVDEFHSSLEKHPDRDPCKVLFKLLCQTDTNGVMEMILSRPVLSKLFPGHFGNDTDGRLVDLVDKALETEESDTLVALKKFLHYPASVSMGELFGTFQNRYWRVKSNDMRQRLHYLLFVIQCYRAHRELHREAIVRPSFSKDDVSYLPEWEIAFSGAMTRDEIHPARLEFRPDGKLLDPVYEMYRFDCENWSVLDFLVVSRDYHVTFPSRPSVYLRYKTPSGGYVYSHIFSNETPDGSPWAETMFDDVVYFVLSLPTPDDSPR